PREGCLSTLADLAFAEKGLGGPSARPGLLPIHPPHLLAPWCAVHFDHVRPAAPHLPRVLQSRAATEPPASHRRGSGAFTEGGVHLGLCPQNAVSRHPAASRTRRDDPVGSAERDGCARPECH